MSFLACLVLTCALDLMPAAATAGPAPAASAAAGPGAAPGTEAPPESAAGEAEPPRSEEPSLPRGDVYVNERFGYALKRPPKWQFSFEPGVDIVIAPADRRAEVQAVARGLFDVRFQQIPEGPITLEMRAAARDSGEPFRSLRQCLQPQLREYLQLFWLDAYVAWHTSATAEEYAGFNLESRRTLRLAGHAGVELVYTLQGKRRPGVQRIKTIIVSYEDRICQLSYIAAKDHFEDHLKGFHELVNSFYMHKDRG